VCLVVFKVMRSSSTTLSLVLVKVGFRGIGAGMVYVASSIVRHGVHLSLRRVSRGPSKVNLSTMNPQVVHVVVYRDGEYSSKAVKGR
jgi:hypothetical protein